VTPKQQTHPPTKKPLTTAEAEEAAALRAGAALLLSLFGLGAAVAAYALRVEPHRLELTRPRLVCPRLPAELDGLRVLLLTDPHVDRWERLERGLIALLERLPERPDVIVWGGDFLHHPNSIPDALHLCEAVRRLFPDVPAFAVLGNAEHKMSARRRAALVGRLEARGMTMLVNRQVPLTLRGATITVAGVDDPYYGHDKLADALAPCAPADRFTLLLSHSPQLALRAAKAGVDVMLSGHTHGGQVRLPLLGPLKTQNPLGRKMASGLFDPVGLVRATGRRDVAGARLVTYVSRGIGVAPLWKFRTVKPRLLTRPEVALLTLHRGEVTPSA
jgi:predicted MPP superfamily phosphohydrolase